MVVTPENLSQPRPLRLIAAIGAFVVVVVDCLPLFGIPFTTGQVAALCGVVGAGSTIAVAALGEGLVTPVASPRDNKGRRLVPANTGAVDDTSEDDGGTVRS